MLWGGGVDIASIVRCEPMELPMQTLNNLSRSLIDLVGASQDRRRADCAGQGKAGHDQHGLVRHRLGVAPGGRAVLDDARRPSAACALSPRSADGHRSGRRAGAGGLGRDGDASQSAWSTWTAAFVRRLNEMGWIEGRTVSIEYRWAEGRTERFAEIAAALIPRAGGYHHPIGHDGTPTAPIRASGTPSEGMKPKGVRPISIDEGNGIGGDGRGDLT